MAKHRGARAGVVRGIQMAIDPNPTRLRHLSAESASRDYTAEAWTSVGQSLQMSIDQVQASHR